MALTQWEVVSERVKVLLKSRPVEVRRESETVFYVEAGLHCSDCERMRRQNSAGAKFFDGKLTS